MNLPDKELGRITVQTRNVSVTQRFVDYTLKWFIVDQLG